MLENTNPGQSSVNTLFVERPSILLNPKPNIAVRSTESPTSAEGYQSQFKPAKLETDHKPVAEGGVTEIDISYN
jgi:hypothetical protein